MTIFSKTVVISLILRTNVSVCHWTIQKSSFVDMLACSDEVQSSSASFIASQQLQTEANMYPTEIPLHSFSSGENPHFVQQNTVTMAADKARFNLVSREEITEITAASKNSAPATQTWMAAWAEWCKARNINESSLRPLKQVLRRNKEERWYRLRARLVESNAGSHRSLSSSQELSSELHNRSWIHKVARNAPYKSETASPQGKR